MPAPLRGSGVTRWLQGGQRPAWEWRRGRVAGGSLVRSCRGARSGAVPAEDLAAVFAAGRVADRGAAADGAWAHPECQTGWPV
jgi:hypothetical protein